jgi:hypothetical protein
MGKMVKVPFQGELIEGEIMPVDRSREEWSEHFLADGTLIRIKPVVVRVVHLPGKRDSMGNRVFLVQANNVIAVEDVHAADPSDPS